MAITDVILCLLLCTCVITTGDGFDKDGYTADELVKVGFTEVLTEHSNSPCILQNGQIPTWIQGYLLRQTCGSFGYIDSSDPHEQLAHWLDCLGMAATYKFNNGNVTFSSRYYDTRSYNIWKHYGKDLKKSRVAWRTIFSPYDAIRARELATNFTDKLDVEPTVTFWNMGRRVLAVTETTYGMELDVATLENKGRYSFKEDNLQSGPGTIFINNPAHEHTDRDGTMWSLTGMIQFTGTSSGFSKYVVYKIQNEVRSVVGSWTIGEWDLTRCTGSEYPGLSARPGYMHVFGLTENYIVILVTSWLMDYCSFFAYGGDEPLLLNGYQWHEDVPSRVLIMRKSDGKFIADMPTKPFLITHLLNAFEEDGLIHIDAVFYPDSRVLDQYTFIQRVIYQKDVWYSDIDRLTLQISDWTVLSRTKLTNVGRVARDFPSINYDHSNGRPYTYGYLVDRLMMHNTSVIKLNVRNSEELSWRAPFGIFVQEPMFMARPGATEEDDGVLLVAGLDANIDKGFVVILEAKTMKEIAYLTAPERTLIGIHNKFIPFTVQEDSADKTNVKPKTEL